MQLVIPPTNSLLAHPPPLTYPKVGNLEVPAHLGWRRGMKQDEGLAAPALSRVVLREVVTQFNVP